MARTISLKAGSLIFCGSVSYEVIGPVGFGMVKAKDLINGEIRILKLDDLSSQSNEPPVPETPLDCFPPEQQAVALQRFAMIKPALQGSLSRKEVEELAAKHGVHYTTVYRLVHLFNETRSPASLIPKYNLRGGKGKHRIPKAVDDLIRHHFDSILASGLVDITKLSISSLRTDINKFCKAAGLKQPSWSTVETRLAAFIAEKKLARKKGRRRGARRPTAGGTFPDANRPLDVVQIDHTPLDIIIVDEKDRLPVGRAYLSLAIDVFSRLVLGFAISLDTPSIYSVGKLISHCILPKQRFLQEVGVEADWNAFGIMRTLFMDNAGEFRAEDFIPFQEEYLVEISWRPVATPEYGGHIERLAKTLNDQIHNEPGSTFSNIGIRGEYDSEGNACYTIDEIEHWLTVLITKEYHVKEHSELGMSPREKYELGILGDDRTPGIGLPDIVEDQERLKLFLLPSFHRTVQRQGVELDKIVYFHDVLRNWVDTKDENGKARKFMFKRDPRRIAPLYFFDPTERRFVPIPYKDLTRPPMSVWELQASKRRCKEKGINDPNEAQLFEAHAERMGIREAAVAKTKQARREREAQRRRGKEAPVSEEFKRLPPPPRRDESLEDVLSFYDDSSLLQGVVVKKSPTEGDEK